MSALTEVKPEKHIYDRQEWSILHIVYYISLACILYWAGFLFYTDSIDSIIICLLFVSIVLLRARLHIVITNSRIKIQHSFFVRNLEILHDEITGILNNDISAYDYGDRFWHFWPWGSRVYGSEYNYFIVIKLNDGRYYVVHTEHTEEVLAAIRKARPSIKIT